MADLISSRAPEVALFFTYGVSLRDWDRLGYLARETQLYQALAERGIRTTFVTYGDNSDLEYASQLAPIKIAPLYAAQAPAKFRATRYLQSVGIPEILEAALRAADLFKTNQVWGSWSAVRAARLYHRPLLLRCGYEPNLLAARQGRSWFYRRVVKMVSKRSYRAADRIHLACEEDRRFVQKTFNLPAGKLAVRMNFVNTALFSPRREQKREKSILYVGRLAAEKNLSLLLAALAGSDYRLTLAGVGEEEAALKKFAEENNIRVDFLGAIPNDQLPGLINRHAVFVLCSRYEGNPKALLEAMACGAAVIGSNVTGINTVIRHGETGWLCEPDAGALRAGIAHLLASPPLRERLGANARRYILETASLESYVKAEAKAYAELIATTEGNPRQ